MDILYDQQLSINQQAIPQAQQSKTHTVPQSERERNRNRQLTETR